MNIIKTAADKYSHALKLRNAISSKKDAEVIIKDETKILATYVEETGDKTFRWKSGLSLTYVSGSPAKETVDYKKLAALIELHVISGHVLTVEDYNRYVQQATKMTTPRSASFR